MRRNAFMTLARMRPALRSALRFSTSKALVLMSVPFEMDRAILGAARIARISCCSWFVSETI
jgi:hypothetical protein